MIFVTFTFQFEVDIIIIYLKFKNRDIKMSKLIKSAELLNNIFFISK